MLAATIAALLMGSAACASRPPAEQALPALAVLGSDNGVTLLDASGRAISRIVLGRPPAQYQHRLQPGHHMILAPDGTTAYVLVPIANGPGEVDAVDLRAAKVRWRAALDKDSGEPRAITMGLGGWAVLALTDRPVAPGLNGFRPRSEALAFGVDQQGHIVGRWQLRAPSLTSVAPEDWTILNATEDAGRSLLYVSFHNQGAYVYETSGRTLTPRCPGTECLPAHGDIMSWEDGLLVATGSAQIDLLAPAGGVLRNFDTHLYRNHLMTFAIDRKRDVLYAVGSCLYVPGLSVVDLRSGTIKVVVPEGALDAPCGETVTVLGSKLALSGAGALSLVAADTGRQLRHLNIPAVDAVALSQST